MSELELLSASASALVGGLLGGAIGGILHNRFDVRSRRHVDLIANRHAVVVKGTRQELDDLPDSFEFDADLRVGKVACEVRLNRGLSVDDSAFDRDHRAVNSHAAEPTERRES